MLFNTFQKISCDCPFKLDNIRFKAACLEPVNEVRRCLLDVLYSHVGEEQAGHDTVLHVPVVQPEGA